MQSCTCETPYIKRYGESSKTSREECASVAFESQLWLSGERTEGIVVQIVVVAHVEGRARIGRIFVPFVAYAETLSTNSSSV